MNPTLVFLVKILSAAILGAAWVYLTLFPMPHSDTVLIGILPLLTLLLQDLTKGLKSNPSNTQPEEQK
jgi:hypothetical protein